jgi:hypothetical protein
MNRLRTAIGACLLLGLAACKTSGFSALQSVNPVMLGPIPSLGSAPPPYGTPAHAFASRSEDVSSILIGMDESGGKNDKSKTVTVDTAHATSSPNQGDFDVLVTTNGDPNQRVTAKRIGCGGWNYNLFYLWYIADAWCETSGDVYTGTAPTPVAAAPAPPAPAAP